jgi:copper chaperone CopZ
MTHNSPHEPSGTWEVKRSIRVPSLQHPADTTKLIESIESVSGVHKAEAEIKKHRVIVLYDASKTDYHSEVQALEEMGYTASATWWTKILASWYQFTDINAHDNAPASACCNKPPTRKKL